jgi:hypothetical protein
METLEKTRAIEKVELHVCIELLPEKWGLVQRVRLEGPATLERVTVGRFSFGHDDGGFDGDGVLEVDARYPNARRAGPDVLVRIYAKPTGAGEVRAFVDIEPST